MSPARRNLARVALLVASTALALAAAEGIYRGVIAEPPGGAGDEDWYARYRRMNETIYMRSEIEGLVYEPRPSSAVEMEYGVAGFDAERRRWDGTARDRTGERVEVALVGDSLAWSELVSVADSLAARLEEALGATHRVSSFGVSGYDTVEEAIYYEHRVRPHAPDVVVVVFCLNDLFFASGPYARFATAAEQARKDAQDRWFDRVARVRRETLDAVAQDDERESTLKILARARALVRRASFERAYVDEYTIAFGDPARRERTRAALSRLGAAIRADGAAAILVVSPILESWDRYRWAAIHAFAREAGEAAGFTVVDPLEGWRGALRPDDLRAPGDQLHYGPEGNLALARALAPAVRAATELE